MSAWDCKCGGTGKLFSFCPLCQENIDHSKCDSQYENCPDCNPIQLTNMKTTFGELKPGDFFIKQELIMMKIPLEGIAFVIKDFSQNNPQSYPGLRRYFLETEEVEKLDPPYFNTSKE